MVVVVVVVEEDDDEEEAPFVLHASNACCKCHRHRFEKQPGLRRIREAAGFSSTNDGRMIFFG